jgi:hypothetical protein
VIKFTNFANIILNQTDRRKKLENLFSFFFSCVVRLLKEWMDQNAKKRMSDSRGRQREKERQWCGGKEKKRTRATLQNKSSPLLIHQNLDYEQENKIVK